MTVGEMVEERMMMQARQGGSGGTTGSEQTMSRILLAPIQALRSLGIWDAEVYEADCLKDDFDCEVFYPVEGNWREAGFEYGDHVRLIVLPCSEKGNDCSGKGNE